MAFEDHPVIRAMHWSKDSLLVTFEDGLTRCFTLGDLRFPSNIQDCGLGVSKVVIGVRLEGESQTRALLSSHLHHLAQELSDG